MPWREHSKLKLGHWAQDQGRKFSRWAQNYAQSKTAISRKPCKLLVRKGGLEPPRFYPPDPKFGSHAKSRTYTNCALLLPSVLKYA